MQIRVVPLGAGQDVGKSCILLSIGGKNLMLDCGMHPGFNDERRFPNFTYISRDGKFTQLLDCIIISHFHLDHCGALPFFTEVCGYDGPIYMTHPTKSICPILLEDYRKITVERRGVGDRDFFTSEHIKSCMKKVIGVSLEESVMIDDDFEIRAFYAGHVLGAAMFYIRVGEESVVYTGDFNSTPDRHLAAASIDRLRPDLLITESTYATTIRDSKRCRERDMLKQVHACVEAGGKVLIPVFALGRAQELCLLLETYWERMNLKVPIYFAAGLTERANQHYKMHLTWMNEKIQTSFVEKNMFDFAHIKPFDRSWIAQQGPMVLFATPGMLHGGLSLEVFRAWGGNEKNLVIMPGYCVAGTVGHKLLANAGRHHVLEIDQKTRMEVRCGVKHLSFSAHADAKGIVNLVKQLMPANVLLVHGEARKMSFLKAKISEEFQIDCFDPPNGTCVCIQTKRALPIQLSSTLRNQREEIQTQIDGSAAPPSKRAAVHSILLLPHTDAPRLVGVDEGLGTLGLSAYALGISRPLSIPSHFQPFSLFDLFTSLTQSVPFCLRLGPKSITYESITISISEDGKTLIQDWKYDDDDAAQHLAFVLDQYIQK